jgi:hypothetical protein
MPLYIRLFQGQATNFETSNLAYAGETLLLKIPATALKSLKDGALWVAVVGLNISGEPFRCESWVNIELELSHRPSDVDTQKALNRMEQGQGASEPEDELLVWAALYFELTGQKLNGKGGRARTPGAGSVEETNVEMTKDELDQNHNTHRGFGGSGGDSRLQRLLQAIAKEINEKDEEPIPQEEDEPLPTEDDEVDATDGDAAPAETQADKRIQKRRNDAKDAVTKAKEAVRLKITKALESPLSDLKAIALIPFLYSVALKEHFPKGQSSATNAGADAGTILIQALKRYAGVELTPACKDRLLPVFACAGAAACLAFSRQGKSAPYHTVLSTLDGFAGRAIALSELQTFHAEDFTGKGMLASKRFAWGELSPELGEIAQAPRLADRIDQLLQFGMGASRALPHALTPAETTFIDALRKPIAGPYKRYAIVPALYAEANRPGCPQCNQALSPGEATRLLQRHIAVCEARCRRPIIARNLTTTAHQFFGQDEAFIAPQR